MVGIVVLLPVADDGICSGSIALNRSLYPVRFFSAVQRSVPDRSPSSER
jgi:hypothetical protein